VQFHGVIEILLTSGGKLINVVQFLGNNEKMGWFFE